MFVLYIQLFVYRAYLFKQVNRAKKSQAIFKQLILSVYIVKEKFSYFSTYTFSFSKTNS